MEHLSELQHLRDDNTALLMQISRLKDENALLKQEMKKLKATLVSLDALEPAQKEEEPGLSEERIHAALERLKYDLFDEEFQR